MTHVFGLWEEAGEHLNSTGIWTRTFLLRGESANRCKNEVWTLFWAAQARHDEPLILIQYEITNKTCFSLSVQRPNTKKIEMYVHIGTENKRAWGRWEKNVKTLFKIMFSKYFFSILRGFIFYFLHLMSEQYKRKN